jgi:hypothetical protein
LEIVARDERGPGTRRDLRSHQERSSGKHVRGGPVRLVIRSIAVAALAAACAGPHAAPPARAPMPVPTPLPAAIPPAHGPAAPAGVLYGPSAMRYVMHQRLHLEQDYGMGTQTQDLGYRVFVSATITGPADSAGYPATLTIDSLVLDSGVVLPPPLSAEGARRPTRRGRAWSVSSLEASGTSTRAFRPSAPHRERAGPTRAPRRTRPPPAS